MGTPDFAVPCLEKLITSGHEVCAVFTQPDKPVGRKQILTPPEVKACAIKHNLPVYQPEKIKGSNAVQIIKEYSPDVIIVVAYGKILPKEILTSAPYGCINVHASLLPLSEELHLFNGQFLTEIRKPVFPLCKWMRGLIQAMFFTLKKLK